MHFELLHQSEGLRTFVIDFATGDEIVALVKQFVAEQKIFAAEITALGGLSDVTLLYFDWDKQDYVSKQIGMQLEVGSLLGQVGQPPAGGDAMVHMHIVVGTNENLAYTGHLGAAHVRPIVQMIIREVSGPLRMMMSARAAFLQRRGAR
jgi:uncharacterized protein